MKIFTQFKKDKKNEIYTVILFATSLFIILALISFSQEKNYIGIVGSYLSEGLIIALGSIGAYIVPLSLLIWGWQNAKQIKKPNLYIKVIGFTVFLVSICGLLSLLNNDRIELENKVGGYLGTGLKDFLSKYVGEVGTYLVLITALVLSLMLTTKFSLIPIFSFIHSKIINLTRRMQSIHHRSNQALIFKRQKTRNNTHPASSKEEKTVSEIIKKEFSPSLPEIKIPKIEKATPRIKENQLDTEYQLPPLSLLESPPPVKTDKMEETLKAEAATLEKMLQDFGIIARVIKICPGPVITRYEIQPAPGVKVNKIVSLSDDIALALEASHVRILAPVPGKAVVGVEVPNRFSKLVYLKELITSEEFQNSSFKLPLALGKTISGESYIADLEQMPHLLIAGATGSGKSICIHSLINSILFKTTPQEVNFIMIDPKMIELPIYNDIPHLITPVITETRRAAHALKWIVSEMENRYKLFANVKARDIGTYNSIEGIDRIPYLILVVDELADLMIVASVEVEDAIIRIAQMARAVGIHIILATQRPSVDVITGVIKANFPARIAFQTLSAIDSRIILDMAGAEDLLGKGDMLYLPTGAPKPIRLQGVLISQKEAQRVVEFITKQTKLDYKEDIFTTIRESSLFEGKKDVLFDDAVRLVINTGQASVSLLQRRLSIGYNRAARLIDSLEEEGIIGPPDGTKPREILVNKDYLYQDKTDVPEDK